MRLADARDVARSDAALAVGTLAFVNAAAGCIPHAKHADAKTIEVDTRYTCPGLAG